MLNALLVLLVGIAPAHAETWTGLTVAAGGTRAEAIRSANLAWTWLTPLAFADRLKIGGGARYTFVAKNGDLDVGDSKAWTVSDVSLGAANLMVSAEVVLSENLEAGMNLDFLGFSHGPDVRLRSSTAADSATVRGTNLFLIGKRDRGTLNSEFYLSVRFPRGYRVSAGLSHQVIEYRARVTGEKLQRFYNLALLRFQF